MTEFLAFISIALVVHGTSIGDVGYQALLYFSRAPKHIAVEA